MAKKSSKKSGALILIISIILTALIVGGGMFVWHQSVVNSSGKVEYRKYKVALEEILTLRDKVENLEGEQERLNQRIDDYKALLKSEKLEQPNYFSFDNIEVGDEIAGMKIEAINIAREGYIDFSFENVAISFSGETELTGTYNYYDDDVAFLYDSVCFDVDEDSYSKMPRMVENDRDPWFCFYDQGKAKEAFGPKGSSGKATIIIDDYAFISYPSEGSDGARLVKVISKE